MSYPTRHCHQCGREYPLTGQPGRGEACEGCGADLRVCLNCISYDANVAYQCRDRRAEPVMDKDKGNFCEYFELVRRVFVARGEYKSRETSARDQLKKLLED